MTRRRCLVMVPQQRIQLFRELVVELSALVGDDFKRKPESTNPAIKNGRRDGEGFFVGEGHQLDVLG